MTMRSLVFTAIACATILTGCMGPPVLKRQVIGYDEVISEIGAGSAAAEHRALGQRRAGPLYGHIEYRGDLRLDRYAGRDRAS